MCKNIVTSILRFHFQEFSYTDSANLNYFKFIMFYLGKFNETLALFSMFKVHLSRVNISWHMKVSAPHMCELNYSQGDTYCRACSYAGLLKLTADTYGTLRVV
jgi:hypothetical protein